MRWVRFGIMALGAFQVGFGAMYPLTPVAKWTVVGIGVAVMILGLTMPKKVESKK